MDALDRFSIGGTRPGTVESPTSPTGVVEVLAQAAAEELAVAPVGGGGALGLGNPIDRYDVALDMRGLDRILEHQAADLVLSVEAGARLSDISEVLAGHGQWLPVEAPNDGGATIGGLIATALSGPGRLGHGSLRDYLIGISVATPTGGLAKAGGMVVKNVSGFDLMRLHHGALGTLGVVVSANFKVLPSPRGQATVVSKCTDLEASLAIVGHIERLNTRPSAVVVRHADGIIDVAARFDGLPGQVNVAAVAARENVRAESNVLVEDESRAWWREQNDALAWSCDDMVEIRLGTRPGALGELAKHVTEEASVHDISLESLTIWPGLGSIILRLSGTCLGQNVDVLTGATDHGGGMWRIAAAPAEVKRGRDVWGKPPASLAAMRRLKDQFDPGRNLNPGRFSGHI